MASDANISAISDADIDLAQARMVSGDWYNFLQPVYEVMRAKARRAVHAHATAHPDTIIGCEPELKALFAGFGRDARIESPFHCSYGINITLAELAYLNTGCVILDTARVSIGARTMLGPGVQIFTADHHPDTEQRGKGVERGLPVTLGHDVWIGGGAILLPGVQIGDGAVVGAGAVVRGDVAPGARVAGVPARAI